jgi:peptidoglycan/LPS O-acetylase OafA/YrhL
MNALKVRASSRVPEVDALRFSAALAVMGFHYFSWAHIDTPFKFGWLGVQLFFVGWIKT